MSLSDYAKRFLEQEVKKPPALLVEADGELPTTVAPASASVATVEQVVELPIEQLQDFPVSRYNRYRVHTGERMEELVENIRCNGILEPLVVRPLGEGYQVISGKNRREAAGKLGYETVPCLIRDLNDQEALYQLNYLNAQYRELRPSEKAFAYQLEHQQASNPGFRSDLACSNLTLFHAETRLNPEDTDGRATKWRYRQLCRFTQDGYLDAVDDGLIKLGVAVNLATLSDAQQKVVWEVFFEEEGDKLAYRDTSRTLNQPTVEKLTALAERNPSFTVSEVEELLEQMGQLEKPEEKQQVNLRPVTQKYSQLHGLSTSQVMTVLDKALDLYFKTL